MSAPLAPAQPLDLTESAAGEEDPGAGIEVPMGRGDGVPAEIISAVGDACPECGGSGKRAGRDCPTCHGTGKVAAGTDGA
ncbi:MAG: hypothetical protein JWQ07_2211 [Ramlibacter sp.]|nr:hypothetical protein [Ramlibacter sp.]